MTKIMIETAEFDLQALKAEAQGKPKPVGKEYQHGEMFGFYNARQYVLWRDGYRCRCCGGTGGKLFVVNSEGLETGSPEDKHTVCEACFKAKRYGFNKKRYWTHPTFMGIMRKTLMECVKLAYPDLEIEETIGAATKKTREEAQLEKSHITDALCISGNPKAKRAKETYLLRPVRRHNRQIHKATILKGGVRKLNQMPKYVYGFQLFDKVLCKNRECFIFGRRTSGSFDVRTLAGEKISAGISYKKLKPLEKRKAILVEKIA